MAGYPEWHGSIPCQRTSVPVGVSSYGFLGRWRVEAGIGQPLTKAVDDPHQEKWPVLVTDRPLVLPGSDR